MTQDFLQQYIILDRKLSKFEESLKDAIESDERIKVTKLQVRRGYKTDPRFKQFKTTWTQVHKLILVFEFICPCGGARKEVFNIGLDWKQPKAHEELRDGLKTYTYQHLKSEGLI